MEQEPQTNVQEILHSMFRIVFSDKNRVIGLTATGKNITRSEKNELLSNYKKQYDFWNSKRNIITVPPLSSTVERPMGRFTMIKNQICEAEIVKICNEVEKKGWRKDFEKLLANS